MALLHVKSPDGTPIDIDLNKIATIDGFTMGNEKAIKFQYGSIYSRTYGHDNTESTDMIFNQIVISADPNPENWISPGAKLALHGYTTIEGDGADGGFSIYASDGTNFSNLNGTPNGKLEWGEKPIEVVDQYSYDNSGYIKYKSGFILQYGYIGSVSDGLTVVFPISFINHWNVVLSNDGVWVSTASASNFSIGGKSNYVYWIAMGN